MADVAHKTIDTTDLHVFAYIASSDPGAVGAGIGWIDTTGSAPFALKIRNPADTGWDDVGSSGGSSTLGALTDVDLTGFTDGDVLTYDTGTSKWIAAPEAGGGALDDLSDVIITTPTTDQVLKYNGTDWVNDAAPAGAAASPWIDVVWGSTYDTFGGTTFTGVGTTAIKKNSNDGTFRTGAFGTVQLTDEGIFRYIVGITPAASVGASQGTLGFGLSHSNAMSPNGIFYLDVEFAAWVGAVVDTSVYASGSGVQAFTVAKGDVLEFRVVKDSVGVRWVSFWKNGDLIYKFTTAPTMNLYLICGLYSGGSSAPTMSCKYSPILPY